MKFVQWRHGLLSWVDLYRRSGTAQKLDNFLYSTALGVPIEKYGHSEQDKQKAKKLLKSNIQNVLTKK
tara:strand:+ start:1010 stop:1213 length:204 start_codon:yes stop_codon:yes gene_type:complete